MNAFERMKMWIRLRSSMAEESPTDLDLHAHYIAQEVQRRRPFPVETPLKEISGSLIPETDKFLRRPVYERYLKRKHHMPLDPPTEEEKSDAIRILRDDWLWSPEIHEEAERIFQEAGIEFSRE